MKNFWIQFFVILSIHKPSLGMVHLRPHTKFGPDRFIGFKQTNKQTNKQTDKQSIYILHRYSC